MTRRNPWANPEDAARMRAGMKLAARKRTERHSLHRWVRHADALDYLRLGWIAQATLDGTSHGMWSVHVVWICGCKPVEPARVR